MGRGRQERGGPGTGLTGPEADDAAENEEQAAATNDSGEAYEDNWYRSLKAFAAFTFGVLTIICIFTSQAHRNFSRW